MDFKKDVELFCLRKMFDKLTENGPENKLKNLEQKKSEKQTPRCSSPKSGNRY